MVDMLWLPSMYWQALPPTIYVTDIVDFLFDSPAAGANSPVLSGIAKGRGLPKRLRRAVPKRGPSQIAFDDDETPVAEPIGPGDEKPRR